MGIRDLLDESIAGVAIREKASPVMDLSKIDFEVLAKRFKHPSARNMKPRLIPFRRNGVYYSEDSELTITIGTIHWIRLKPRWLNH